jgi:hypothetical protein
LISLTSRLFSEYLPFVPICWHSLWEPGPGLLRGRAVEAYPVLLLLLHQSPLPSWLLEEGKRQVFYRDGVYFFFFIKSLPITFSF